MGNQEVDAILNYHIAAAADKLKSLYDLGEVTFSQVKDGLKDVGLDLYLEDWLHDTLRKHNAG